MIVEATAAGLAALVSLYRHPFSLVSFYDLLLLFGPNFQHRFYFSSFTFQFDFGLLMRKQVIGSCLHIRIPLVRYDLSSASALPDHLSLLLHVVWELSTEGICHFI